MLMTTTLNAGQVPLRKLDLTMRRMVNLLIAPKASAEGACILTEMGNCYEVCLMTVVVVYVVTVMV